MIAITMSPCIAVEGKELNSRYKKIQTINNGFLCDSKTHKKYLLHLKLQKYLKNSCNNKLNLY